MKIKYVFSLMQLLLLLLLFVVGLDKILANSVGCQEKRNIDELFAYGVLKLYPSSMIV